MKKTKNLKEKTILEQIKEKEENFNLVSRALGFSFNITLNPDSSATLRIYQTREKLTCVESLTIKCKSQIQLIIEKDNQIISNTVYSNYFVTFIYNYLYYKDVKFLYQYLCIK